MITLNWMDKIRQFIAAGNNSEEALAKLVRWGEREEETLNERLAKDLEEVNEELARSKERFANVKDLDEMTDKELCELYEQMFGEKIGKEELPAFYNSEIDGRRGRRGRLIWQGAQGNTPNILRYIGRQAYG